MFGMGFAFLAIGAYLVDCAVQNRHPIQTLELIVRSPGQTQTVLQETKGTFDTSSSSGGTGSSSTSGVGAALTSPGAAPTATTPRVVAPKNRGVVPVVPSALDLVTVQAGGQTFTVARSAASQFVGFVNALASTGYKLSTVQGYNDRNIAGTGTKSLHSFGRAIDINPSQNTGGNSNLPKNVAALAAKFGLNWGGDSSKYHKLDSMHFSIPTAGYSY